MKARGIPFELPPTRADGWRARAAAGLCAVLGIAALCAPDVLPQRTQIVYNASDSVARGWYRVQHVAQLGRAPHALRPGTLVLVHLPAAAAALAAQRGYLPGGTPLLKRVAAVAPQRVCVRGRALHIDGAAAAALRARDGVHRPLPAWDGCRRLVEGEVLLLGDADAASFDSRYFGPLDAAAVIGVARPLWDPVW